VSGGIDPEVCGVSPAMTRAVLLLASLSACALAFACSHEASAPSAVGLREPAESESAPVTPAATALERPAAQLPESAPSCIDVEAPSRGEHVTLEGRLFVDNAYEHPTRGKTHPYILRLDEPRCAVGIGEPTVTELHLAAVEGITLKTLAGKHVRVSGDPFSAHTAWHARPIVLMTTRATSLP
jgi:hypothetical protein